MAGAVAAPSAALDQLNDPGLDQRVSIAFVVIDTFFLALFCIGWHFNRPGGVPMLVCNVLCYIFCLGSATAGILMVHIGGVGHHVTTVPTATFQTWLQLSKTLELTYTPAVMFAKLAALFLYYQVFEVPVYRRVIVGIGVIIVLQGIIAFILALTICRPFRYFWTQVVDPSDGTCGNVMLFYKSYSIPSLVTDVAILVLPWPILLKLQMPRSEKIGLYITFLAASMGLITCALRFAVFFTTPLFSDPTWYASGGPMIYALVEPSIYMIATVLATMRPLVRRLRGKAQQSMQRSGGKSDDTSKASSDPSQAAELGRAGSSGRSSRKGPRHADAWPDQTYFTLEKSTARERYQD